MAKKKLPLKGLFPAIAVPFDENLRISKDELANFVRNVSNVKHVGGIVANGHAGEVTTLSPEESAEVIKISRENAPDRVPVIAGIEALSTRDAIQRSKEAKQAGADILLVLSPFDCRPRRALSKSVEAPFSFFLELSKNTDLPLVVFQYPHWTGLSYTTETLVRLSEIENVIGVKNGIGTTELYAEQYFALKDKMSVLVANDSCDLLGMLMVGSDGALIGISNVATELWARFVNDCLEGNYNNARELFVRQLLSIAMDCYKPSDPTRTTVWAMTKETLAQLGVFKSSMMRPPDLGVSELDKEQIRKGIARSGILPPLKTHNYSGSDQ